MNNELLAFEHAYDDLKAKYDSLRENYKQLECSIEKINAENSMVKEELLLHIQAYDGLKSKYEALEKELAETKEKLKDMIGQRDRLYGAYNDISENLREIDSKYRKLSAENQMLKDDLCLRSDEDHVKNQKTEINRLLKSNASLKKENDRLRSDNEVYRLNNSNLSAKIDELNKGIANSDDLRVLDKYNALKEAYAKAKNLIDNLEDQLADKDESIEFLKEKINNHVAEKIMLARHKDHVIEKITKERDRLRELYFESIVKEETSND